MGSLNAVAEMLEVMVSDNTIPKNIRKALSEAKERILSDEEESVKVSAAIYLIESVSDDINMPAHARMQIWTILGQLESVKKS